MDPRNPTSSSPSVKLMYHYVISYSIQITPVLFLILLASKLQYSTLESIVNELQKHETLIFLSSPLIFILILLFVYTKYGGQAYLLNFSCSRPDKDAPMITREFFIERAITLNYFTGESIEFQKKILERSGIGNKTYFPPTAATLPPVVTTEAARREVAAVIFAAIDDLLIKTGIKVEEIDILVTNCSLFSPTPTLSDMIVNRYKLREDVMSFSLAGMGCSAGLISVDLARNLLKVHKNSRAMVVSTESLTQNGYPGNNREMLVTNCLFRVGGAAVLLSNRRADRRRAKYRLTNLVRTHIGAHDESYGCVSQEEDTKGNVGIALSKDLMNVAADALKMNITKLGPLVLPVSEQLLFAATIVAKKVFKLKMPAYIPDFKIAFEHFCIHAGGRALLDAIEKNLSLTPWHMEPSRMTLYRFGNTSSSSLWYELAYSEAKGRIKKGDRVWQLAFGSGFKFNSLVWKALRNVDPEEDRRPWLDEIHLYPVPVPKVMPIVEYDPNGK